MTSRPRIVHVLDDLAMGGVTRALKNFEHPGLAGIGKHETVDIRKANVRATGSDDIAVIHFTANWRKLPWLADLRLCGGFSKVILIEHTYTEGFRGVRSGSPGPLSTDVEMGLQICRHRGRGLSGTTGMAP